MLRRTIGLLLLVFTLFSCAFGQAEMEMQKYTMYFFDTFDTMVSIIGYAENKAVFDRVTLEAKEQFEYLHRLYDGYRAYEGVENIFTLNRDAALAPVKVEPELMDMLVFAKEWQEKLQGTVNIAMGGVFKIWHDYRTEGIANPAAAKLPPMEELKAAAIFGNMEKVELDIAAGTVFFTHPGIRLDVGAVAKGYAAEWVARRMLQSEMPHFIISAGGNVRAGQPPMDGRADWGIGLQKPDALAGSMMSGEYFETLYVSDRSVVTSGDYERFYEVEGVRYHHIISPETLMPADEHRAITVVCEDSGQADILSTAIFILPYAEGRALVENLEGVEALWVEPNGVIRMTEGMKAISKSGGETAE